MSAAVSVPVIASGGAGDGRTSRRRSPAGAEAALVASIVHERPERLRELKAELKEAGWHVAAARRPAIVQDADERARPDARLDGRGGAAAHARARRGMVWSRSRQELLAKGATSGNTLAVEEFRDDCDGDAILLRVRPAGPACHTGAESCFAPWLWRRSSSAQATGPRARTSSRSSMPERAAAARKVGEEGVEAALAGGSRVG